MQYLRQNEMIRTFFVSLWLASLAVICQSQSLQEDLNRARQSANYDSNAEIDELVMEIAKLQKSGDLRKATDRCDRAAALAFKSGAVGRAFELSLVGAELSKQRSDLINAADRFERAAIRNSNDPRAVEAHHQAALLLAKEFRHTKDSQIGDRLDKILTEHSRKWPRSKYASEMTLQSLELLADRGKWEPLIKVIRQVAKNEAHYERSHDLLQKAYEQRFLEALDSRIPIEKRNQLLVQMSVDLEPMILGEQRAWPTRWTDRQYEAARILSAAHLTRGEAGAKYATTMLGIALRGAPPASPSNRKQMITFSAIGWLLQDNEDRAVNKLTQIIDDAKQARFLIKTTKQNLKEATLFEYPNQAKQLLATIETLEGRQMISNQQKIAALLASGQRSKAIAVQRQLAHQNPDSHQHQMALARLLASGKGTEEQTEAITIWQRVESRLPAGMDSWHEARLARIRLMIQLGKIDQANKLLNLSRLLAPVTSGTDLANSYDELRSRLVARSSIQ